MIRDKIITITKKNQFNRKWTLFRPYSFKCPLNNSYKKTSIRDVVRLITYSNSIDLILSEPCLTSQIVKEIEWVNKYIQLNIIAKSTDIIKKYKNLKFSSVKLDPKVNINYLGIKGKQSNYFIIEDMFLSVDDSIEKMYFTKKNISNNMLNLSETKEIIIIDDNAENYYSEIIDSAKKLNINCFYVVNVKYFNKNIFEYAQNQKLQLVVSEYTKKGIILIQNNYELRVLTKTEAGFYISYPLEKLSSYIGGNYLTVFSNETTDIKKSYGNLYTCDNGKNNKLNIVDKKTISIDVPIKLMSDFVLENFDSSITEKHNDYSAEAFNVEYNFRLIPPRFNSNYCKSNIYGPIQEQFYKWKNLQTLKFDAIYVEQRSFANTDYGLIEFLKMGMEFTNDFSDRVKGCKYKGYKAWVKQKQEEFLNFKNDLLNNFKNMFSKINENSSIRKFDKFDDEIAGYKQTIIERQLQVDNGIEVLSNKRRIEILEKKISELLKLKEKFENSHNERNEKESVVYLDYCKNLLEHKNQSKSEVNNDSISNVIHSKEETNVEKLYAFTQKHLVSINEYLDKCLVVLEELSMIDIPEDYIVYDYKNEKFIVINSIEEFKTTKELCNKFNLKCIAESKSN